MQNQNLVERAGQNRIGLPVFARRAEHHVQEILDVAQRVLRIHEGLALIVFVAHRGDGRQFGDQAERRDLAMFRIVDIERIVIERSQRADYAAQHRHRVRVAPESRIETHDLLVQHRVPGNRVAELVTLRRIRQFAVKNQVRDFEKIAMLREIFDRITAVHQNALVAIDVGDRRTATRGRHESGVVRELARLGVKRADVDHVGTDAAAKDRKVDRRRAIGEGQCCELFGHNFLRGFVNLEEIIIRQPTALETTTAATASAPPARAAGRRHNAGPGALTRP